jgi:hypothetical protein
MFSIDINANYFIFFALWLFSVHLSSIKVFLVMVFDALEICLNWKKKFLRYKILIFSIGIHVKKFGSGAFLMLTCPSSVGVNFSLKVPIFEKCFSNFFSSAVSSGSGAFVIPTWNRSAVLKCCPFILHHVT